MSNLADRTCLNAAYRRGGGLAADLCFQGPGVLLDHVLRADLMLTGLAINSLLFGKEHRPGHGPEPRHLTAGVSHYMREGSRQVISSTEIGKASLTTGRGRDEVRSRENKFGGGSGSGSQCVVAERPAITADITPHT